MKSNSKFKRGDKVLFTRRVQELYPLTVISVCGNDIKTSDGKTWRTGNLKHYEEKER